MNIWHILRKERSPYHAIHATFWIITWIFALWMFAYCNGWTINFDVVRLLPQKWYLSGSILAPKSSEFLERFWFVLIDTQSDAISISLDHGDLNKKIIQEKISYGLHHIHIEWWSADSIDFDFEVQNEHQFIRRNFSLLSDPRIYKISENTWEKKEESLCLWIGTVYLQDKRNCKQVQQYKYGSSTLSWSIKIAWTNTVITPMLANEVGYTLSWFVTIPREYFWNDIFALPTGYSGSIRHIFNYIGGSYLLTSSGTILPLGKSRELTLNQEDKNIKYIQSIGGDLFVLKADGSLVFYDELFRRVVLNDRFDGPMKVFVYEHAYILSTLHASYLYQPYEKRVKEIAAWPLTNISGEILSFLNEDNSIQKIILSPINLIK